MSAEEENAGILLEQGWIIHCKIVTEFRGYARNPVLFDSISTPLPVHSGAFINICEVNLIFI